MRRLILSLLSALVPLGPVAAQRSRDAISSARVDSLVERYRVGREVPGIAVSVVRHGSVVKAEGYGLANLELQSPVTPRTLFGLGSISKQFTATAIMQLVEDGRVRLDESITSYLDSLPRHWAPITVRHLLTHTSGLPEERWRPSFVEFDRHEHDHLEVLRTIFADSLQSAPGAAWAYRNSAYRLLGMIIEKASGESYWAFLDRRIFRPLGMAATRSSDPKTIIAHRAKGYAKEQGRIVNRDPVTASAAFSEGALMSSLLDLARWDSSLYRPRFLSQASLDQMWTPAVLADGTTTPYGLGWTLAPTNGLRTVGHGGFLPGFHTIIMRYLAKGLTVIVLTNAEWSRPVELAGAIAGLYEPDLAFRPEPVIADADPAFTVGLRSFVEALGRGELHRDRLAPEAGDEWAAAVVEDLGRTARRFGALRSFELVERIERDELVRRRYRVRSDRGTLIVIATSDRAGGIRAVALEDAIAGR
jgi:D-alanyl-D-alanine carboxypeptidase